MGTEQALREWVVEHKVCWEVARLVERDGGRNVQVGYELRLASLLYAPEEGGVREEVTRESREGAK